MRKVVATEITIKGRKCKIDPFYTLLKKWAGIAACDEETHEIQLSYLVKSGGIEAIHDTILHDGRREEETVHLSIRKTGGVISIETETKEDPLLDVWYRLLWRYAPECELQYAVFDYRRARFLTNSKSKKTHYAVIVPDDSAEKLDFTTADLRHFLNERMEERGWPVTRSSLQELRRVAACQFGIRCFSWTVLDFPGFLLIPTSEDESLFYSTDAGTDAARETVGHLRFDNGHGEEFWSTWHTHNQDRYNIPSFKAELDAFVNCMRKKGMPFSSREDMRRFCFSKCAVQIGGRELGDESYGCIFVTASYIYCIRLYPHPGDYSYIYIYRRKSAFRDTKHDSDVDAWTDRPYAITESSESEEIRQFMKGLKGLKLLDTLPEDAEGILKVTKFAEKNYPGGGDGIAECMSDAEILSLIQSGGKPAILEDMYCWMMRREEWMNFG